MEPETRTINFIHFKCLKKCNINIGIHVIIKHDYQYF